MSRETLTIFVKNILKLSNFALTWFYYRVSIFIKDIISINEGNIKTTVTLKDKTIGAEAIHTERSAHGTLTDLPQTINSGRMYSLEGRYYCGTK